MAVFSCSYLVRGTRRLRWIQARAAVLWMVYGILLHAIPVIAANLIVAAAAAGSVLFDRRCSEGNGR